MNDNPKLYVIGAGAMGSLFGGLLAEGGMDVTLVDVWQEHVDNINRDGLKMVGYGGDRFIPVRAVTSTAGMPQADIVFVQCKAVHSEEAVKAAQNIIADNTVFISFQNGLGNEEVIASVVGDDRVLGGLTAQGASIEGPGVVHNYAELPTWIGEMGGGVSERTAALSAVFSQHGLPTSPSENIRLDIWKKLMANVGISAASGISNLKIREIMAIPEMKATIYAAIDEAVIVGKAAGVELDSEEAREVLAKIAGPGGSGENKTSLCNDILNQRPSEIDFINGAIVKLGKEHGIKTPINSTLVAAVKALQSHYM
ncbi:MAG: ketopantoate reductase family protein [Thiolinea sp.]